MGADSGVAIIGEFTLTFATKEYLFYILVFTLSFYLSVIINTLLLYKKNTVYIAEVRKKRSGMRILSNEIAIVRKNMNTMNETKDKNTKK